MNALDDLIHDVKSKCASLTGAAALLRKAEPKEANELLSLMAAQAKGLAEQLSRFQREESRP